MPNDAEFVHQVMQEARPSLASRMFNDYLQRELQRSYARMVDDIWMTSVPPAATPAYYGPVTIGLN